jgi:hypothetical protein
MSTPVGPRAAAALLACAALPLDAAAVSSPAAACTSAEHRAFDFWLGDWQVTSNGKVAGRNRIESILGGCALMETWQGAGGGRGRSLNAYDPTRRVWHQTWVDGQGTLLVLEGGWHDGAMQLLGVQRASASAAPARQRITWTPNGDGSVRQLWESSLDGGRTWSVVFDGHYVRVEAPR